MKLPLFILAAFALLTSCTRPIPPQKPHLTKIADNVAAIPGGLMAAFPKGESAIVYFAGSAAVVINRKQIEIAGMFYADDEGWGCSNPENGDYLKIYRNGKVCWSRAGEYSQLPRQTIQ